MFPKGGVKIGPLPLTWGYLLLGLTALLFCWKKSFSPAKNHLYLLLAYTPFQLIATLQLLVKEIEDRASLVALLVTIFALPLFFFFLLSEEIQKIESPYLFKLLKRGIFFVASYGIFLFLYKLITDEFLMIPMLTVNLHDIETLGQKHIDRGFAFKLISTYNNGNLYGICLLMLLPLYRLLEPRKFPRFILTLSLLLTLSRTVWAGLLFSSLFQPVITFGWRQAIVRIAVSLTITLSLLSGLLLYFDIPLSFLFDSSLGGRLGESGLFPNGVNWISLAPFRYVEEMIYPSMIHNFGLFGFMAFMLTLLTPFVLFLVESSRARMRVPNAATCLSSDNRIDFPSPEEKALMLGLITYLFIALSDGAYLLIPTMAIYNFLAAFMLRGKPFQEKQLLIPRKKS